MQKRVISIEAKCTVSEIRNNVPNINVYTSAQINKTFWKKNSCMSIRTYKADDVCLFAYGYPYSRNMRI